LLLQDDGSAADSELISRELSFAILREVAIVRR
jgi:hypothetical protein